MNYLGSLIFYGIVIIITVVFTNLSLRVKGNLYRGIFKYCAILVPSIVAGIRCNVGTDYNLYSKSFNLIKSNYDVGRYEDFEIGYKLLNKFVAYIGGNFNLLLFIMSFFTILFMYKALVNEKENISVTFGMLVYMLMYYQTSLNLLRQCLAISICIYAITCLNRKSIFNYLFYVLVASLFHRSALICLGIILVKYIFESEKMKVLKWAILGISIFLVFNKQIIGEIVGILLKSDYYSGYFLRETESGGSLILYFIKILPILLICVLASDKFKGNKNMRLYYYVILCGYILGILRAFSMTQVQRISYYFTYLTVIVAPFAIINMPKKYLKTVQYIFVLYLVCKWYVDFFYNGYSETVPYQTFLFMN